MNETELGWVRNLLALFDGACAAANVSYFLYGGSLLGFRSDLAGCYKKLRHRFRDFIHATYVPTKVLSKY